MIFPFLLPGYLQNSPAADVFCRNLFADGGAEVPRSFRDYAVSVDRADLPAGVELNALVG